MTSTRLTLLVSAGAAAAVLLTACSSSGDGAGTSAGSPGGTPAARTSTSSPVDPSSAPDPAGAPGAAKTLTADLSEFKIALSASSLSAGTYHVRVRNAGKITHALTFDGPGVDDMGTGDMPPGAAKTLTVTLKAGTYEVFCPVGDHKMEGMDTHVAVR